MTKPDYLIGKNHRVIPFIMSEQFYFQQLQLTNTLNSCVEVTRTPVMMFQKNVASHFEKHCFSKKITSLDGDLVAHLLCITHACGRYLLKDNVIMLNDVSP